MPAVVAMWFRQPARLAGDACRSPVPPGTGYVCDGWYTISENAAEGAEGAARD